MDLGFVFSEEDKINSNLSSIIPGFHIFGPKKNRGKKEWKWGFKKAHIYPKLRKLLKKKMKKWFRWNGEFQVLKSVSNIISNSGLIWLQLCETTPFFLHFMITLLLFFFFSNFCEWCCRWQNLSSTKFIIMLILVQ